MKIIDLLDILNPDRSVLIIRAGNFLPSVEYDSIKSVELKFALEEVDGLDMNTGTGSYEIYTF